MMKHRVTNQDPGSGQFDELVPEFSSQCYADMMSEDKSSFSMRPLPKRNPKVNGDHEDALKDMLNSMDGYNYGSPDEFLKKVNTEIDRMHEYMSKRKGIVIEEISEELAKFRQKRDVVDKDCKSSLPGKNLPDENNNIVVKKQEKGGSGVDLAMFKMRQLMENKKYEMEDSEWEHNAKLRGYTVEDVQKYNLEMIEDILEIIKASKDLVAASAEFQRLSQKANRKMEKQVKEAKNKGMLDDALEVVRSIGALMMVASDAIDGKISKEYSKIVKKCVKNIFWLISGVFQAYLGLIQTIFIKKALFLTIFSSDGFCEPCERTLRVRSHQKHRPRQIQTSNRSQQKNASFDQRFIRKSKSSKTF